MSQRMTFLGWDRPLLELAADHLLAQAWRAGGLCDLSHLLVVVPTRQAGRRLRRQLALRAEGWGGGVLPPKVETPEALLKPGRPERPVAQPAEQLSALAALVWTLPLEEYPHLFPEAGRPKSRSFGWALGMARQLTELMQLTEEAGFSLEMARRRLEKKMEGADWEPERWRDLARLEGALEHKLKQQGLMSRLSARLAVVQAPALPEGIAGIVMIGTPDPMPLALEVLRRLGERVPVEIAIQAPASLASHFDEWGRPKTEVWIDPDLELPLADSQISLQANPEEQSQAVFAWWRDQTEATALGVVDERLLQAFEPLFREAGRPLHNPAGRLLATNPLAQLLGELGRFISADSYDAFASLLRNPDILVWQRGEWPGFASADCLKELDRIQNKHLVTRFAGLQAFCKEELADPALGKESVHGLKCLLVAVEAADGWRREAMDAKSLPEYLRSWLHAIYRHRVLGSRLGDHEFAAAAEALSAVLDEADSAMVRQVCADPMQQLELLTVLLSGLRYHPEPAADQTVEVEGWLELAWNPAPRVVLAGFNEGCVPESVVGHPFLPDQARRKLGLLSNDRRLARDTFLLAALLRSRQPEPANVRIFLGRTSNEGDVLRPSRLLFRCPEAHLPVRVKNLFAELRQAATGLAWHRAWQLAPLPVRPPARVSVTAFRDYLACPFRFYLKKVLGMERQDDRKTELDAADFGNLCHHALDAFGKSRLRDSQDEESIGNFLVAAAERQVHSLYGRELSTAIEIQLATARQRLRAAARIQTEQCQAGWRIIESEFKFEHPDFAGLCLRGTADRIDRHEDGRLRILDYKTFERAENPIDKHCRRLSPSAPEPRSGAGFEIAGDRWLWTDLQVPLYCLLLAGRFPNLRLQECGYFLLPKAITETQIRTWSRPELANGHGWADADWLAAAEAAARQIAAQIAGGVFWPPAEKVPFDEFECLFEHGTAEAVAWPEAGLLAPAANPGLKVGS